MNNKYKKNKLSLIRQIALERIIRLFELIEIKEYHIYKNRYSQLALDIGMRYRIHIPQKYKHRICKYCNNYLLFNQNCRIRLKKKYKIITCFLCGHSMHYPYK